MPSAKTEKNDLFGFPRLVKSDEETESARAVNNLQVLKEIISCRLPSEVQNVLNKYFAMVYAGEDAKIFFDLNEEMFIWKVATFKKWCENKSVTFTVPNPDPDAENKFISKNYALFPIYNRSRFEYTGGVRLDPGKTFNRYDRTVDAYNLWRGWKTVAKKWKGRRRIKAILRFIFVIICDKNVLHYHWVCSWIADLIQNPANPKGVALVLIGLKGIGKTFFAELIQALIGKRYSYITAKRDDVFGHFSGHLVRIIFLVLEEAIWASNKQNEAVLKVLITGKDRSSRTMYHDSEMIDNFLRLLILANPGWVIPASQDERRYTVLYPSEEKMQNRPYFRGLIEVRDNGGLEEAMYFFQHYRIGKGGVDIGEALKTQAIEDQKDESLDPFDRWLLEEFTFTGYVKSDVLDKESGGLEIVKSDLREVFLDWCRAMGIRYKMTIRQFGIRLGASFPKFDADGNIVKAENHRVVSIFEGEGTHRTAGKTYRFPSLNETRLILGKRYGKHISYWNDGADEWGPRPL